MVAGPSVALVRDIQTLFDAGTVGGLSDRQLLERFTTARDGSSQAAFEVLVRRHGPMVLRVCRNVLKDWNDAEDAFQATFVVLARRCGSIRRRDSVESWLFGVASRVAARARVESARRRAIERRGAAEADSALGTVEPDQDDLPELGPIVQEEVRRLPEKYRAAVVLCYWEGLTQEQAAAQIGCPLGTVRSRLARARDLLRRRLARRGVTPVAGLSASAFDLSSIVPVPAAVPDSWVAATLKQITPTAAGTGPVAAGAASASVAALVRDTLRRMLIMKLKMTATFALFLALGAAGAILAAPQVDLKKPAARPTRVPRADQRPVRTEDPIVPAARGRVQPAIQSLGEYVVEPPDTLLVEVLEALPARPISGERLVRPDGKISLGFYGEVYVAGLTPTEIKEKVVAHLRKYLSDRTLGLTSDEGPPDIEGDVPAEKLRQSDRVFVEVSAYNSKNYYVQGRVHSPGRFVITGHDTVLDAINYAGGLTPAADRAGVVLYRMEKNGTLRRLPIDIDQITVGDDPSTNYQLLPGDRLVIPSGPGTFTGDEPPLAVRPPVARTEESESGPRTARRPALVRDLPRDVEAPRRAEGGEGRSPLRVLELRLDEVERKLDRILEALDRREKK